MKRLLGLSVLLIIGLILPLYMVQTDAVGFDSFDCETSFGGASLALSRYLDQHENGGQMIAEVLKPIEAINSDQKKLTGTDPEDGEEEEIIYDEWKIGVVCVESSLNVRASTSILSDVVGREYRGMEVYVIGEKTDNAQKWYKVNVSGVEGYMMGQYILFDRDAENFALLVHNEARDNTPLPEEVLLADDRYDLPDSVRKELEELAKKINYSLKTDFPAQREAGSYVGMYSVLVYMLENYEHIMDIVNQYGLSDTKKLISQQVYTVELNRERLSSESGYSDDELWEAMVNAAAEAAAKARAEAEAQERAWKESLAYKISRYAEEFVGWLPYVWGGASLKDGADCSGFCGQIYAHFGLLDQSLANSHAYDSYRLRSVGYAVSLENIQPGDLVCYPGHVGIYYGNGVVIHAPSPGRNVAYGNLYMMEILTIRRLY